MLGSGDRRVAAAAVAVVLSQDVPDGTRRQWVIGALYRGIVFTCLWSHFNPPLMRSNTTGGEPAMSKGKEEGGKWVPPFVGATVGGGVWRRGQPTPSAGPLVPTLGRARGPDEGEGL